ncbi:hypothetical protein EST92_11650 [Streptomyces sp. TM32]|uniref:hypothetical protein n=1 Tax=Streptomyces sp. TM32 TaxID=1652669 RepID=UPI001010F8FA|nr:hypothetical protein [Streptomyces sp. TM32]RXS84205.1 hypothetical protein EST92_11650 [Streptomyces sp. TM32]
MSRYLEEAAAYHQAAERWRVHALRGDSLGETARRQHTKSLARAWKAEERAAKSSARRTA